MVVVNVKNKITTLQPPPRGTRKELQKTGTTLFEHHERVIHHKSSALKYLFKNFFPMRQQTIDEETVFYKINILIYMYNQSFVMWDER